VAEHNHLGLTGSVPVSSCVSFLAKDGFDGAEAPEMPRRGQLLANWLAVEKRGGS